MKTNSIYLATAFFLVTVTLASAQAPQYTVTAIGFLPGGVNGSYATGVNNLGQVSGYSDTTHSNAHAFIYSSGSLTDLTGTPNGFSSSFGYAINNLGQVAGLGPNATLYSNGTITSLGTLPEGANSNSEAYGINDLGQEVGQSQASNGAVAVLFTSGSVINLGALGGSYSIAYGINNSGQVAGQAYLSGNTHTRAFIYSNGVMTNLGTLGGNDSGANGINNLGQATGYSSLAGSGTHAFLYSGGVMGNLGTLGGVNSYGFGINGSGQVTGVSQTAGSLTYDAFIYTGGVMYDLNSLVPSNVTNIQEGFAAGAIVGNPINDWGQIAAEATVSGVTQAILLSPVNPLTSVSGGVQDAKLVAGMNFNAIAAYTNTTGSQTTAAFLDGTASRNRDVQVSFLAATAGLKSDIAQLSITAADGTTQQDKFVLSLSYTGSPNGAYLGFFNTNTGQWENAVMGNSDGGAGANFINGAYNPAADFVLGDYGINTANDTVWAVVDHNSEFAVIPEPSTWVMLTAGAGLLIVSRRRRWVMRNESRMTKSATS